MKYFEQHHVEEIRQRADIVTVIQRYVPLQKRGNRFMGICPFHNDSSPSMHVTPAMGLYKCFACGAGGDAFKFLMEHERMDFPGAVVALAELIGYELPERTAQDAGATAKRRSSLEILAWATTFFSSRLERHPEVQDYLSKRSLSLETLQTFSIGYAPPDWDALLQAAQKNGIAKQDLIEAGLVVDNEKGKQYDRYRNRVIIPIHNLSGKVVGFGGRALDPEEKAKYINSPETQLYKKSELLFGLSHARKAIVDHGEFYVVEGYMDFLQLWQHGFHNACAVSGTALTSQHVGLLQRFAKRALLIFDGDAAGRKAARRSIPLLLKGGIEVQILDFPEGEDPDSLLRSEGPQGLRAIREKSKGWVDWLVMEIHALSTPEEIGALTQEIRTFLAEIPDPVVRQGYARKAAAALGLDLNHVQNGQASPSRIAPQTPSFSPNKTFGSMGRLAERQLVEWILRHPILRPLACKQLPLDLFQDPNWGEIADHIFELEGQGNFDLKRLYDRLSPNLREKLAGMDLEVPPKDDDLATREYVEMLTRLMLSDIESRHKALPKDDPLYAELARKEEGNPRTPIQHIRELRKTIFPGPWLDHEKFGGFLEIYASLRKAFLDR